jgi:hypothetical protein
MMRTGTSSTELAVRDRLLLTLAINAAAMAAQLVAVLDRVRPRHHRSRTMRRPRRITTLWPCRPQPALALHSLRV